MHAAVRAITLHAKDYRDLTRTYADLLNEDPEGKNSKTLESKEKLQSLQDGVRYSVLNRRTAWVATKDWMARFMKYDASGKPTPKNPKASVWVMAVRIKIIGANLELSLQPCQDKGFSRLRCVSLKDGEEHSKLTSLLSGYEHVLQDNLDADDDVTEDHVLYQHYFSRGLPNLIPFCGSCPFHVRPIIIIIIIII